MLLAVAALGAAQAQAPAARIPLGTGAAIMQNALRGRVGPRVGAPGAPGIESGLALGVAPGRGDGQRGRRTAGVPVPRGLGRSRRREAPAGLSRSPCAPRRTRGTRSRSRAPRTAGCRTGGPTAFSGHGGGSGSPAGLRPVARVRRRASGAGAWRHTLALVAPGTVPFPCSSMGAGWKPRSTSRANSLRGKAPGSRSGCSPTSTVSVDPQVDQRLPRARGNVLQTTRMDLPGGAVHRGPRRGRGVSWSGVRVPEQRLAPALERG